MISGDDNGRSVGMVKLRDRKVRRFSINDFWNNIGCLILAPTFDLGGSRLWQKEEAINIRGNKIKGSSIRVKVYFYEGCVYYILLFYSLLYYDYTNTHSPHHICGIPHTRSKEFKKYWPQGFYSEQYKKPNEQWRSRLLINSFNNAFKNISASYLRVGDESMSGIRFCTTVNIIFPHLSYIFCKPEPLGIEFKTVIYSITRGLI